MIYFNFKKRRLVAKLKMLLDLRSDFDEQGAYALIYSGTEFRSGNAWGLIFAIFIASIGLNVNSTAVIIGAMLISPLMGPIVGAGFAIGTHDFDLLKKSAVNLSYAVAISIITSTLFFIISPTGAEKSELLARTQPTIFDVLIAFFGGSAGIVASTRLNKGNAVPGVAIATALMPPLCTVGFGIAHLEWQYAVGAIYLFSINAVFILIATYLFTRILGFKLNVDRDPARDKTIHRYMTWGSIIFIIPSILMAWYLHKKSQFENNLQDFFKSEFNMPSTIIAKKNIAYNLNQPIIDIYLFGEELSEERKLKIHSNKMNYPALRKAELNIHLIQKDNFSINDLEEKFITKSEFSQLLNVEKTKKDMENEQKVSRIVNELTQKFNKHVTRIELIDNEIKIFWRTKPNKIMIKKMEMEAYKLLLEKDIMFVHSILVK